jgi:hypothetical protein
MKTAIFMIATIALGALGVETAITMSQAYAANNGNSDCADRGLNPGCSPGQHLNEKTGRVVGNPHYPQSGGDKTGDPHDATPFNPDTGNPHYCKVPPCK